MEVLVWGPAQHHLQGLAPEEGPGRVSEGGQGRGLHRRARWHYWLTGSRLGGDQGADQEVDCGYHCQEAQGQRDRVGSQAHSLVLV